MRKLKLTVVIFGIITILHSKPAQQERVWVGPGISLKQIKRISVIVKVGFF